VILNICSSFVAVGIKLFSDRIGYSGTASVVRVLGYRSGGLSSIPGTTRKKKVVSLERGALSLVSTTEELLERRSGGSCLENREYCLRDPSR
jgi:hypothetical protein